ncbi:hypothetical protein LTR94_032937, partial [Friedmanniomyces endolithicus]
VGVPIRRLISDTVAPGWSATTGSAPSFAGGWTGSWAWVVQAALAPIEGAVWGREAASGNRVAREWLTRQRALLADGMAASEAGRAAALRVFGDAPGAYGAGVNRLTERSGAWREREEIGRAYRNRMGHAYGLDAEGASSHRAFDVALDGIHRTYHGRASNL